MENPNHSNERYEERNHHDIKKKAFETKQGYSHKRFESKLKDQMGGMPMPNHMRERK